MISLFQFLHFFRQPRFTPSAANGYAICQQNRPTQRARTRAAFSSRSCSALGNISRIRRRLFAMRVFGCAMPRARARRARDARQRRCFTASASSLCATRARSLSLNLRDNASDARARMRANAPPERHGRINGCATPPASSPVTAVALAIFE